ncbi:MAG: nucleotide exchange factor GrpE [Gemmataceae bacterium]|nr:nucleotide exchange factor GrpE [Gemmataceae bacterium]
MQPEQQPIVIDDIAAKLAEVERQRDEYLAMAKEKQAEFENYQKRAAKERAEEMKYFNRALVGDLLPALDNLDRALAAAAGDTSPLMQGVAGTQKQLLDILQRHGVARIEVAPGTVLNPNEHEAVAQQPHAEIPAGSVIQACAAGYRIHERIIRPAAVLVSSGPAT